MGFSVSSFSEPLQCCSDLSQVCATILTHLSDTLAFSSALQVVMMLRIMSMHMWLGGDPRCSSPTLWDQFFKLLPFQFLQYLPIPWGVLFLVLLESYGFIYTALLCAPTAVSAYRGQNEKKAMGFASFP